jgi:beta-phosphoglucomutase
MTPRESTPRFGGPAPAIIRALIYDFDDTIVETERVNDALFSDYLRREHSVDLSPREQELLYGFSWSGVFAWLKENRGLQKPKDEVWTGYLEVKREFLRGKTLRTATGLERMLALPVPQAIVSGSTREEIQIVLESIRMPADAVDFILSDEDGGTGKPDPQGFLHALERFGVKPEEALVFEDSPAGIEAAKRAGIPVAFVAELASRDSAGLADMHFASLAEAWGWVRERIAPR